MRFKAFFTFQSEFIFEVTNDGSTTVDFDDVVNLLNFLSDVDTESGPLRLVDLGSENVVGCHISVISWLHHQELTIAILTDSAQSQSRDVSSSNSQNPIHQTPETDCTLIC